MADEPSNRAQWNVKVAINLMVLVAYLSLLAIGVMRESLTITEALSLLGSTALGGGIGWAMK